MQTRGPNLFKSLCSLYHRVFRAVDPYLQTLLLRVSLSRLGSKHQQLPNTMVTIFPACIIHPLVTMLAIMNRVSASSEDNLEMQVMRGTRPWTMKSGAVSCYTCWPTFPRWSLILRKYSTLCPIHEFLFHKFPLLSIQPPLSFLIQGISTTILASLKGSNPDGNGESS